MAGLKLAILQGLSEIQSAFPKTFNSVLRVFGKIGDGFIAVWDKVTGFLTEQWNGWGKKTLDTVLEVATLVPDIWKESVESMANWMLEQSAKGGVMGKAMSKVLGVDMADVQAESARLDAKAKGLGLDTGPTDVLADARKAVSDYTKTLVENAGNIGGKPGTGKASAALEGFLASLESGDGPETAKAGLDALLKENEVDQWHKAFDRDWAERQKNGTSGASGAGGDGGVGGPGGLAAAPTGSRLTATYSAAAAQISGFQAGGGGSPEQKIVNEVAKVKTATIAFNGLLRDFIAGEEKRHSERLIIYTETAKNTGEMTTLQRGFIDGQRVS
jgi:hypothetical protein